MKSKNTIFIVFTHVLNLVYSYLFSNFKIEQNNRVLLFWIKNQINYTNLSSILRLVDIIPRNFSFPYHKKQWLRQ